MAFYIFSSNLSNLHAVTSTLQLYCCTSTFIVFLCILLCSIAHVSVLCNCVIELSLHCLIFSHVCCASFNEVLLLEVVRDKTVVPGNYGHDRRV